MGRLACVLCAVAVLAAWTPATVSAQQTSEAVLGGVDGGSVFKTYCGSCHGKEAKGDGPLAESLRFVPPDLTLLAKRNKGEFDAAKVHRIIDGRDPVKGHGGPDMPVWGDAFKRSEGGFSEQAVKVRIDAIVAHLKSIQAR
jgi:mono/diheme cytochrome c family protein